MYVVKYPATTRLLASCSKQSCDLLAYSLKVMAFLST